MGRRMTRRTFLRSGVGGAVGLLVLKDSALARTFAANEKVNVALCGVGGRGLWYVGCLPGMCNLVAMCDVDEFKAKGSYEKFPDLPKFADYRVMLDKMDKEIDAVVVSTPEFSHATISAEAMRHGKGVFTEKPLTHDVWEARRLRALAREHKVATQQGNQGSFCEPFRQYKQLIETGVMGEIKEVWVWHPDGGQPEKPGFKATACPETLHWDLWLGPRDPREFHLNWFQGWRTWREFGTNQLGWWAPHTANLAFMALKVASLWPEPATQPAAAPAGGSPRIKLTAKASSAEQDRFPAWHTVDWEIPARGDLPPITFHWVCGSTCPDKTLNEKAREAGMTVDPKSGGVPGSAGALIIGTKGTVQCNGHCMQNWLLPAEKFKDFKFPAPDYKRSRGHEMDWLLAVKGAPDPAWSNFDYSGPFSEFLSLGNIANRMPGETLEFDPVACKIVNNDKANELLRWKQREGFTV